MQNEPVKTQDFLFVPVNLSAADDTSKEEQRRLVRSNAANYQWSRQKRRQPKPTSKGRKVLGRRIPSKIASSSSTQTVLESSSDEVEDTDATRLEYEDQTESSGTLNNDPNIPSLYSGLTLLPQNQIGPLMQFNIQYIVPRLVPHIDKGVENPAAGIWIHLAINSPVLYSTWTYCSMIYYDALRNRPDDCMEHKISTHSRAISLINEQMQDSITACSDENLLAVCGLAAHGQKVPAEDRISPKQGPLRDLQGLELYSLMEIIPLHFDGLALLVKLRGGLSEVKTRGIGGTISYMGLVESTKTLAKPRWPFIPLGNIVSPLESMNTGFHPNHPLKNIGSGFAAEKHDHQSEVLSCLFAVIHAMCDYTVMVYNHCEGQAFQASLCAMTDQRNFIHHTLLSLPENYLGMPAIQGDELYESIRLATIVYSFLVVFPASATIVPFTELSIRIKKQLLNIDTSYKTLGTMKTLVWILFMGGVSSLGSEERSWFVLKLTTISNSIDLQSWTDVKRLLESFLWLGNTNDADGMKIWSECAGLHPLEVGTTRQALS